MSVTALALAERRQVRATSDVDIVIPVYNEEEQLASTVTRLRSYLDAFFPFTSIITIADNGSTDGTWSIATDLATRPDVRAIRVTTPGRGRALRAAWSQSSASVVAYMDVDLSTGLEALVPLVAPLLSGQSDLAIGTRLARGAHVVRGARRELISRCYNLLLRSVLRSSCTDAQCGFKAMRREASLELVPLVQDDMWFFDTEMLVMAQRLGFRIHEVPVHWVDDTDSRVDVIRTALMDLRGMWRLLGPSSRHRVESSSRLSGGAGGQYPASHAAVGRPAAAPGASARRGRTSGGNADTDGDWDVFADDLLRFAGVGVLSTSVYVGLFAVLRPGLGSYAANAVAIGICSVANTAVHRSIVGASRCRYRFGGRWAGATGLLAVSLGLTTLALVATRAIGLDSLVPQLFALTIANLTAAVIRFGVLRTWIFPPAYGRSLTYAFHNEDGTRADPRPARPPTGTTIEETRS